MTGEFVAELYTLSVTQHPKSLFNHIYWNTAMILRVFIDLKVWEDEKEKEKNKKKKCNNFFGLKNLCSLLMFSSRMFSSRMFGSRMFSSRMFSSWEELSFFETIT